MPTLLKNLMLEELSLVDRPANAQAMVSLFKRDDSQEDVNKMTEEMEAKVKAYMEDKGCGREEAMKALNYNMEKADEAEEVTEEEVTEKADEAEVAEEVQADFEALKEQVETLKAENERLRKGLLDEGYVIKADVIEKKVEPEFIEYGGEKINKADVPAPILKALEEAEIEKADAALTKRAEAELPHFSTEVAKKLLVAVEKMDEMEMLMEALKAADKAFADKMEEFGKSDADGDFSSSADKLDALVKSYMDEHKLKKSEYAKAYAAVAKTDEGKALITKSYKGD